MQVRENTSKRVVFFGSDAICLPALNWLKAKHLESLDWLAIISQPDRRQGRGQRKLPNPVAEFAQKHGITLLQPEKPGSDLADWLVSNRVDIAFVMAYGHFIGRDLREAPTLGMFNFHASILPKYRGASPIESAIASGEKRTGVSLMEVDAKMDSGAVSHIEYVPIADQVEASSMRSQLGLAVVAILEACFEKLCRGQLVFKAQDEGEATYCRKLSKADGLIDFNLSSESIFNRWRAFTSWPTSYCYHGEQRIKVGSMRMVEPSAHLLQVVGKPGTVHLQENRFFVKTGDGWIELMELQRPSGKLLSIAEFLRGYRLDSQALLHGGSGEPLVRSN